MKTEPYVKATNRNRSDVLAKTNGRKRKCVIELLKARNRYFREVSKILRENDLYDYRQFDGDFVRIIKNGTRFVTDVARTFANSSTVQNTDHDIDFMSEYGFMTKDEAGERLRSRKVKHL